MNLILGGVQYIIVCAKCKRSIGGPDEEGAHVYEEDWFCTTHHKQKLSNDRYQQVRMLDDE